jgi:hypothetical protein
MCEIHYYKCRCGRRWTDWKKLPSCHSMAPDVKCDDSLCLYAGHAKKPEVRECEYCRWSRDAVGDSGGSSLEEGDEEEGVGNGDGKADDAHKKNGVSDRDGERRRRPVGK